VNSNKQINKVAVIGLDVEDWYHLDYIGNHNKNTNVSMLDGFTKIIDILNERKCKATLFIVGELIQQLKEKIILYDTQGFEIASHGYSHKRPLILSVSDFTSEIVKTKKNLEKLIKKKVIGFRAPCFSLDRKRLDILFNCGYSYDSSKIDFKVHSLYGNLDMSNFIQKYKNIFLSEDKKFEFELPTFRLFNKKIPFSGGGYLRILPEVIIKKIIIEKEKENEPIFFYIHPFEFSKINIKSSKIGIKNYLRMNIGRASMPNKLDNILKFMTGRGWNFTTFQNLHEQLS